MVRRPWIRSRGRDFRTAATEPRKTREDKQTSEDKRIFGTHPKVPDFWHSRDPGPKDNRPGRGYENRQTPKTPTVIKHSATAGTISAVCFSLVLIM